MRLILAAALFYWVVFATNGNLPIPVIIAMGLLAIYGAFLDVKELVYWDRR